MLYLLAILQHCPLYNTRAAKSIAITNKSQPKRQVKQISLQCSTYFKSGIRDIIQNIKAHITYL